MAERLLCEDAATVEERVTITFRRTLGRPPTTATNPRSDQHEDLPLHAKHAAAVDKPIAGGRLRETRPLVRRHRRDRPPFA
jgi:hypothetical protein